MPNPIFLDHFRHPRNAGELADATVTVIVENPACGDVMKLAARIESDCATAVRFQVRGCAASIAAGSVLTELLLSRPLPHWHQIDTQQIDIALGGLPMASRHAAELCVDAVRALLRALGWPARP